MNALVWVHVSLVVLLGAYALLKEREELGCSGFGVRRQCRDEDSVYVRGTSPRPGDSRPATKARLSSILRYHEKGGVWKRCFLLASVLVYVGTMVSLATRGCSGRAAVGWTAVAQHIVFFCVMYMHANFVNYHHFRVLKAHGDALLAKL